MSECKVYSKTMKQHLEIVDRDGLPGIRLLPGDHGGDAIALRIEQCNTSEEEVEDEVSVVVDKTKTEEEDTMGYIKLDDGSLKQLTKGQKKMLGDTIEELEKEDQATWTTLREKSKPTKNPGRLLPRGCGVALMELFSGAAALSLMVATLGLPVAEPIDIMDNDNYDLLRPEVRRMVESRIEVEDPLLLSMAPVCGPSSPLQNLNEMREDYADNFYNLRQQWYPVVKWLTDLIKKRPSNGREVLLENPWPSKIWTLKCMLELLEEAPCNNFTGESLELQRLDQCEYGLNDHTSLDYLNKRAQNFCCLLSS